MNIASQLRSKNQVKICLIFL